MNKINQTPAMKAIIEKLIRGLNQHEGMPSTTFDGIIELMRWCGWHNASNRLIEVVDSWPIDDEVNMIFIEEDGSEELCIAEVLNLCDTNDAD